MYFNAVIVLILRNDSQNISVVKSDMLQYDTVGRRDDGMIVPLLDWPVFTLIDWEWFGETGDSWLLTWT